MADIRRVLKGQYLIREREESTEMYFVKEGTFGVFKVKGDVEVQIESIYSGEIVGELSFLDEAPRSASVKALVDSEVVVVPRHKFDEFMKSLPPWFTAMIHTLTDRLRKANARIRV